MRIYRDLAFDAICRYPGDRGVAAGQLKGELLTADEILRKVTVEISAPETESETRVGILKVKASWVILTLPEISPTNGLVYSWIIHPTYARVSPMKSPG